MDTTVRVCVLAAWLCMLCLCVHGARPVCVTYNCQYMSPMTDPPPEDMTFKINGKVVTIGYIENKYVKLVCAEGVELESREYPRFKRAVSVPSVMVSGCSVPRGSLHATLAALGLAPRSGLALDGVTGTLTQTHFHNFTHIATLQIQGSGSTLRLHTAALRPLVALTSLTLSHVVLSPNELTDFPRQIESLRLKYVGIKEYDFNGFQSLRNVTIYENHAVSVRAQNATSLLKLFANPPELQFLPEEIPSSLEQLNYNWKGPERWSRCSGLKTLNLHGNYKTAVLPASWVTSCTRLGTLSLDKAHLQLSSEVFRGATSLQQLHLTECNLKSLPEDLFKDNVNLSQLSLKDNLLKIIPSELFSSLSKLESLDLSRNKLTAEVGSSLASLETLQILHLSYNPSITDLCSSRNLFLDPGFSSLKRLTGLKLLVLSNTSVTRVCSDWRIHMKELKILDLSETKITRLTYLDLQYERSESLMREGFEVNFKGANISRITIGEKHYKDVLKNLSNRKIALTLKAQLQCDCNDFWTAVTFNKLDALRSVHLTCRGDRTLSSALEHNELECLETRYCEGEQNCTCLFRRNFEDFSELVTMRCTGLDEMPAINYSSTSLYWRLLLPNNHIRTFSAQDLPSKLLELDLRNNSLVRAETGTAAAMTASRAKLWLSGNPELDCTCSGRELVWAGAGVADRALARCADGSALSSAVDPGPCGAGWLGWALGALGLGAVAAGGAAAYCARPETRLRAKVFLLRVGWLRRTPEPDDGRRFDAFVSYAHEDGGVVEELVRRLEAERGYRLCLHYRDWGPGEWIHVQIAASVEASRRTLVVVSRHFLRSKWARQEFREAHAAALTDLTPRLLLLFLEPPSALPLDAELRNYIRINTYLLWDDPWFWRKLLLAMPPPPPRPAIIAPLETDAEVNK